MFVASFELSELNRHATNMNRLKNVQKQTLLVNLTQCFIQILSSTFHFMCTNRSVNLPYGQAIMHLKSFLSEAIGNHLLGSSSF